MIEQPTSEISPRNAASPEVRAMMGRVVSAMQSGVLPAVECPLQHVFTPGLYMRTIHMPAGALIVSKIHRTEHPFIIQQGRVRVWQPDTGWRELTAPHQGVTTPGTQRLLEVLEDTVWTTCHATTETDPEVIEAQIIEPFEMPPDLLAENPQPEALEN